MRKGWRKRLEKLGIEVIDLPAPRIELPDHAKKIIARQNELLRQSDEAMKNTANSKLRYKFG